jgi:hypothetical protein
VPKAGSGGDIPPLGPRAVVPERKLAMLTPSRRAAYVLAGLVASGIALPSFALAAIALRQSDCEIRANRFKAVHPHTDPLDFMKSGFFYFGSTLPPHPPPPYRDPQSGITFHVGGDGRRITAVDAQARLLWVRDPFVDRNMCPYRDAHPSIVWIGAPGGDFGWRHIGPFKPTPDGQADLMIVKALMREMAPGYTRAMGYPRPGDRFIGVTFTSSQHGYVNIRNGDYYDMGQN